MSALQSPVPTTLAKCELRTPLYVHLLQPDKTKGPDRQKGLSRDRPFRCCPIRFFARIPASGRRVRFRYGYGLLTRKKSAPLLIG